ncbi:MAG: alpha-L-fucosidase [Ignavibacteriales bacterium]|nr:MAG: alpha-L-fucosidase [Ignavibacteriales bacterium]
MNMKIQSPSNYIIKMLLIIAAVSASNFSQILKGNYVVINPDDSPEQIIEKAANVIPSTRHYEWQKLELTAFIHFGINTFDNVEWGKHSTDISKFNPAEINVKQWVSVLKDAGFKLLILTAKHHDGFCLWPSKFTDYNISKTLFQNGNGDIVKDLSNACREVGIKFGVYLSPWDLHEKTYGTPEYNIHFTNQLTELLTKYGEISEVWFDGANGEGPNGKKQEYDWQAYYQLIRKLQPGAVIAVMGPDVRWVGTESGYGRQTEWSVLPGTSTNQNEIAESSQQQAGDGAFIPRNLMDEDLGSREKIQNAKSLVWYPAEIDVSIRPGWFYHQNEDELVKSPYKLADIYYNAVGMNGVLLLNVPPDKRGLINEKDIKSLQGFRYLLDETFKENFAKNAKTIVSNEIVGNEAKYLFDEDVQTFWTTDKNVNKAAIEIQMTKGRTFNCIMLQENILEGQRIEKFHFDYLDGQLWRTFTKGTTIGYKRLLRFPDVYTDRIKIIIDQSRTNPTLSSLGIYKAPPEITFEPNGGSFKDTMKVKISCDTKRAKIYYTLDGSTPDEKSTLYNGEILLTSSAKITTIAVSLDKKKSLPVSAVFSKAKYSIDYKTKYDDKYPGSGNLTLVDGINGSINFNDGKWQGYNGNDVDVVIDLGAIKQIGKISSTYLSDVNSFIFLPQSVIYSISDNGKDFVLVGEIKNDSPQNENTPLVKSFETETKNISGRYIRVNAKNIGVCPAWHKGAGEKAWIFVDEINVQ